MRVVICALAIATISSTAAIAADAPSTGEAVLASDSVRAPRMLYICDATPAAKRAFAREFGAVEYVKAADVKAKGDTWVTPKCITPAEARRLRIVSAR